AWEHPDTDECSLDVRLTTDELKALRELAGSMNSEFLDLSKNIDFDRPQEKENVAYDAKISYLRGGQFIEVDSSDSAYDIDALGKIGSSENFAEDMLNERIALIINGKEVDGEIDFVEGGLSRDIFNAEDEDKQWKMWMISEEEMNKDFQNDWTSTWTDWLENTQELTKLQSESSELEGSLKQAKNEKLRESILKSLKKHNVEMQIVIRKKKRQIFSIHRRMQLMTYYELLRVDKNATEVMIQSAYDEWEKDLSPDETMIREFSSIVPLLNQVSILLDDAYGVLINPEKRSIYDEKLAEYEASVEILRQKKKILAEDHLMSARTAYRRGDHMLAMRFLRGSMSLDSSNAIYYAEMAKILAENNKWRKEALQFYHRAFHLDPDNHDILFDVASLAHNLNLDGFARKVLNQILKKNPKHLKAKHLKNKLNA
ncbi:DnaJ domain-containing protein, partial [bacterium]|nr:DnaJ domain-containing protein [bacterium]